MREALGTAGIAPAEVAAVTAASMREGFVLYDEEGREIWACPNIDARAGAEATEMIAEGLAERQYRRGGDWTSITAPARLRWIRRHQPEVLDRARHLTMLGDWVIARFSGVYCTDPSLGSSSNLFDLTARAWSAETARELALPDLLPPVVEAGTVVGGVTAEAAAATGLLPGTAVVAGGADTQLALLAAGLTSGLRFATVGGTFWQSAAVTNEPVIDPEFRLRTLCHVLPGSWMIEGVGFLHGLSTRWVRDALLRAVDPGIGPDEGYERLERLAAEVPAGANGLTYLASNVMDDRRWRHGPPSLIGLDVLQPERTGLGAIFRAVEEEAAYVARGHYEILTEVCGAAPESDPLRRRSGTWPPVAANPGRRARRAGRNPARAGGDLLRRRALRPRRRRRLCRSAGSGRGNQPGTGTFRAGSRHACHLRRGVRALASAVRALAGSGGGGNGAVPLAWGRSLR